MFTRNTLIDSFRQLLITSEKQYIMLVWPSGSGKSHLLNTLRHDEGLSDETTLWIDPYAPDLAQLLQDIPENIKTLVFDSDHGIDESYFRTFIESYSIDNQCIFTTEERFTDEDCIFFSVPFVSFREYAETTGYTINMGQVFSGESDISWLNKLKDAYIYLWDRPRHIDLPESIHDDFLSICTNIQSELFEKEYTQFIEFMRTLAMETGNAFKADKLAKLLGITRRKVNKYMELLLKHGIVKAVGPWVQDTDTETSRHVKIYFADLTFYRSLLSDMYYQGAMKLWALENFIYLELERKLRETHDIFYYRKKSGSEVTFILEERSTKKITPIEVVPRDIDFLSQALKSFDSDYHDRVERYMIMNESKAEKKDLNGKMVLILPHATI